MVVMNFGKKAVLGILCLVLGLVGGLVGYSYQAARFIEKLQDDGVWFEKSQYLIKSPYSELNVVELGTDSDEDGIYDMWTVFVNEKQNTELRYTLEDLDRDGVADRIAMSIGPQETNSTFGTFDSDNDKKIDFVNLSLGGPENNSYAYKDLNLDGRLDVVTFRENGVLKTTSIIDDYYLYPAKVLDKKQKTYLAHFEGTEWKAVRLEGTKWISIPDEDGKNTEGNFE
jgi:hypothetical protein